MIQSPLQRLEYLIDIIPPLLSEIGEPGFSSKSSAAQWSRKEIVGHLIDSATNNHQRFVRGQFEHSPVIEYDQDKWNEYSFYQQMDGGLLIAFWTAYNRQLVEIIRRIPPEHSGRTITVKGNTYTLAFLAEDYVAHMEHHLRQFLTY